MMRVLSVGLLAGLLAGVVVATLQNFTTTPLILQAEVFENAEPEKKASLRDDMAIARSRSADAACASNSAIAAVASVAITAIAPAAAETL